jgi:hypothetical protein
MLLRLLTSLLIFTSLLKTEPSTDLIRETREKFAEINISFLKNNYPEAASINELGNLLNNLKQANELPKVISVKKDFKNRIVKLIDYYKTFEKFYQDKPDVDTLKKVFRVVNNEFNTQFGNYFIDELKKFSKKKIILFSTSMSCECTLEMCYKQEAEIQKLLKENPNMFDYAVVDCFTNFDLQSKYEIGFIPTVIVLSSKNKEVKRIVREEHEIEKIILGE